MSRTFIANRVNPNREICDTTVNRTRGAPPFTGSLTPLESGLLTLNSILTAGLKEVSAFVKKYADTILGTTFQERAEKQEKLARRELEEAKKTFKEIVFQYFPEDLRDTRTQNITDQDMLIASDNFPTLGSASKRVLSFKAIFSQERIISLGEISSVADSFATNDNWDKYNFDVAKSLQAIRSFTYPIKGEFLGSLNVAFQPVMLHLPGTLIGINQDKIFGAVTSYSITYKSFFPNGRPRLAEVDLEFTEYPSIDPSKITGIFKQSFQSVIDAHATNAKKAIGGSSGHGPRTLRINWEHQFRQ